MSVRKSWDGYFGWMGAGRRGNLFELDPDLGSGIVANEEAVQVEVLRVPEGPWSPPDEVPESFDGLGLLVLDGVLVRREGLAGDWRLEPVGPGDLIRPLDPEEDPFSRLPTEVRWRVLQPSRLAVITDAVQRQLCQWPEVVSRLANRHSRRIAAAAQRDVIRAVEGRDERLLYMLWHLASRFGRVTTDGVRVPVPLSQTDLGALLGLRRGAISEALGRLRRARVADQRKDLTWWLAGPPVEGIEELADSGRPVGV